MDFRNETEILISLLQNAGEKGLIQVDDNLISDVMSGKSIENQYVLDLATHATILAELEQENYENYLNGDVRLASGEALDRLGFLVGITRIPGSPALVEITISTPTNVSESITIPSGTQLILDDIYSEHTYLIREDIELPAGVTSINGFAVSEDYVYQPALPEGMVKGIVGFPTLNCTNHNSGSHGKDIENDEEYRTRIQNGLPQKLVGTQSYLKSYLDGYTGLDGYCLVPKHDGIGTLKIVCDTIPSLLSQISEDVYNNCMSVTDSEPVCVLPENTLLSNLTVTISQKSNTLSDEEMGLLIKQCVNTFVEGGTKCDGSNYRGMSIGEDFNPGQLIAYLFSDCPELLNVVLSVSETIIVPDTNKFKVDIVTVVIE